MFNDKIEKIGKITYSQQIHSMLGQIENLQIEWQQAGVIAGNMIVAMLLFALAYKKSGLES